MMTITGLEPSISKELLEGKDITTRSTGYALWHSTSEQGRQEALEICFKPTETSMECIGFEYDKVTKDYAFNASINLGYNNLIKRFTSPVTVLSYLKFHNENAELKSKFICKRKPIFIMDSSIIKSEEVPSNNSFQMPKQIPMNEANLSLEEDDLWNNIYEIWYQNSIIPTVRSKEELFIVLAALKKAIENSNVIYLNLMKNDLKLSLNKQNML